MHISFTPQSLQSSTPFIKSSLKGRQWHCTQMHFFSPTSSLCGNVCILILETPSSLTYVTSFSLFSCYFCFCFVFFDGCSSFSHCLWSGSPQGSLRILLCLFSTLPLWWSLHTLQLKPSPLYRSSQPLPAVMPSLQISKIQTLWPR